MNVSAALNEDMCASWIRGNSIAQCVSLNLRILKKRTLRPIANYSTSKTKKFLTALPASDILRVEMRIL